MRSAKSCSSKSASSSESVSCCWTSLLGQLKLTLSTFSHAFQMSRKGGQCPSGPTWKDSSSGRCQVTRARSNHPGWTMCRGAARSPAATCFCSNCASVYFFVSEHAAIRCVVLGQSSTSMVAPSCRHHHAIGCGRFLAPSGSPVKHTEQPCRTRFRRLGTTCFKCRAAAAALESAVCSASLNIAPWMRRSMSTRCKSCSSGSLRHALSLSSPPCHESTGPVASRRRLEGRHSCALPSASGRQPAMKPSKDVCRRSSSKKRYGETFSSCSLRTW
mmetsp:Transcript_131654/g.228046  ORF Transcript_131654/g.228046 Transcript_131654/m.228046 type:complete len:273 (-) Transcript_131654:763-1581(-)